MTVSRRKSIPMLTKLEVVLAQNGCCKSCGEHLGRLDAIQFDHRPALWERQWDDAAGDTIPPANSVEHIEALHVDCHAVRTHGTKATSAGSDANRRAKAARLTRDHDEFRARLLAKAGGGDDRPVQKRSRWPRRPFRRRSEKI